jgi:hypothetical protein
MKRTFSVWNPDLLGFDYFEGNAELREGVIAPVPKLPSGGKLGLIPEQAAMRLPSGARRIGSGDLARGLIATRNGRNSAMGDFLGVDFNTAIKGAILVGGAWLLWTKVLSPTQRRKATVYAYGRRKRR